MASERTKLVGIYIGGQIVFCFLGPICAILYPALFAWWYWRSKKEIEEGR